MDKRGDSKRTEKVKIFFFWLQWRQFVASAMCKNKTLDIIFDIEVIQQAPFVFIFIFFFAVQVLEAFERAMCC